MSHLLIQADARRIPLGDGTVHCVCTSPPYWGLRNYSCDGQIGLEQSPAAYVAALVQVFREVWRVLRDDGTVWLNLGDSYTSGNSGQRIRDHAHGGFGAARNTRNQGAANANPGRLPLAGTKPKDLCMIPARVAIALCDDGWYLRSACPWVKRAAMPEPVTDRPSSALEYIFLLAKRPDYFYDIEATRVPLIGDGIETFTRPSRDARAFGKPSGNEANGKTWISSSSGRNRRNSDWWFESVGMLLNGAGDPLGFDVNPGNFTGARHFATWPPKLVEPMILASTSAAGCCPTCGAPWRRLVEKTKYEPVEVAVGMRNVDMSRGDKVRKLNGQDYNKQVKVIGESWSQSCPCPPHDPVPATVLDPFCGAGTTLVVAETLGRVGIGCDLSRKYLGIASHRIDRPHAQITTPRRDESLPLFDGFPAPPPLAAVEAEGGRH